MNKFCIQYLFTLICKKRGNFSPIVESSSKFIISFNLKTLFIIMKVQKWLEIKYASINVCLFWPKDFMTRAFL